MTSKTSLSKSKHRFTNYFHKGLIASDLKRFGWVGALYALFLFLLLPFHHMTQHVPIEDTLKEITWFKETLRRSLDLLSGENNLQIILICIIPVILAVLLFRYLHTTRATAAMHSLPFNRKTLYWSHSAAGLLLLTLPVLLTGLVLIMLNLTTFLKECYSLIQILQWMGATWLFNTLFFFTTVFVGMFTGNSIAQLAFTYILHLLPFGLYSLLDYNLSRLLYGYVNFNPSDSFVINLPLFLLLQNNTSMGYFTASTVITYCLVTLLFSLAAYYAYKVRKLETAGDVIAFSAIRPVFKYGVTACTMLLSGVYFSSMYSESLPLLLFGYLLGSLLGYGIAEIILQKFLKVWSAYKGYLGYAMVIAVLLIGVSLDVTGYVHRIPQPEEVDKVYLGRDIYGYLCWEKSQKAEGYTDTSPEEYARIFFFTEQDNIKNITLLHKQLLEKPNNKQGYTNYIIYTLKNGKQLIREYRIDEEKYTAFLKPIYESVEYKKARFPVLTQNSGDIKLIEIKDHRTPKKPLILTSSAEIQEFSNLLKGEILAASYEQIFGNAYYYVDLDIEDIKGKKINYNLRPSYQSVIQWLKDKGYYDKIVLLPEEIEYVTVEDYERRYSQNAETAFLPPVEIREPELIYELFNIINTINDRNNTNTYRVTFCLNGSSFDCILPEDIPTSDALKEYLKQAKK